MKALSKIILIFFSSLLLLILAAVILIPLLLDLNDFKVEIEAAVKDKIGRTLKIEDDLQLSVFPWLGVSTGKLSLSNAAGFTDEKFAVIQASDIKIKLMPLFSQQIEVNTITLKGLELYLAKNKQGITSWDDLVKPKESSKQQEKATEQPKPTETTEKSLLDIEAYAISLSGVALENALISWDDQKAEKKLLVKNLNLTTSTLAFDAPVELKLAFLLENSKPADSVQINLSTQITSGAKLQKIHLANFKLDSTSQGESIPSDTLTAQLLADIVVDLSQQTLALSGLKLNTNLINLTADLNASQLDSDLKYAGSVQIAAFNPKKLLQQLHIDAPQTSDPQALQQLAMAFDLQGTSDAVSLQKLTIALDDTKIIGEVAVKQFSKPFTEFDLNVDTIDVDRYTAPEEKNQAAPTTKQKTAKAKVSTPATAIATATTLLPLETIRALNLSGVLKIAQLKVAKLSMADVRIKLKAKDGVLQTEQKIKKLYQGHYQGKLRINAQSKTPTINLDEKVTGLQLEPFLQALQGSSKVKLKGRATISAKLNTRGNTMPALKSSLGGKLNFLLKDGAVRELNLQKMLDLGKLAINGKQMKSNYKNEQTLFSKIQGSAKIKRGLVNNPDFLANSSTLSVKGKGTINLVNDAVNYHLVAKLKNKSDKKNRFTDRPISINITGTLDEPIPSIDLVAIKEMLTPKEKQKIEKFIDKNQNKIDKAVGKETGKKVNKFLRKFF